MAQRPCLLKTEYLTEPFHYFQMIHDKTKYMKHADDVREDLILVNYEENLDIVQGDEFENVIISAYLTAQSRLKLYEELLGKRVLYFDTDSCIYIDRLGQPYLVIEGDRLGAWTDEYPKNKILHRIRQYEGLIKCKVLPPKDFYHPVLPHHFQGKLLFPLCRTCAGTCNQDQPFHHIQKERDLTGTWVSVELFKALDMGYQLLEVYEMYDLSKKEQYHKVDETQKGIFADYMDAFLKLLQEASSKSSFKNGKDSIDLKEYCSIQMTENATLRKFRTTTYTYTVKFKDFVSDVPADEIACFITDLIYLLLEELQCHCKVKDRGLLSLSMCHDSLKSTVSLGFSTSAKLTSSKLLGAIEDLHSMRDKFDITDGKGNIHMAYVLPPWEENDDFT